MGKSKELAELGDVVTQSGGKVGIGNTTPDGQLTVGSTATSGDISIRIKGDETSRGFLMFGDAGGIQLGDIMYDHSDNHMRFRVNNSERMRIDASGRVTMPYQPMFNAYDATGGTSSYITFANTRVNIGNHFNTSTGTFTAPVAGSYLFCWNGLHNTSVTSYGRVIFAVNGSASVSWGDNLQSDAGSFTATGLSQIIYLSTNDTVKLYNEGNPVYAAQYAAFSGCLIG